MEKNNTKMSLGKKILIGFGVIILIGILSNLNNDKKDKNHVSAAQEKVVEKPIRNEIEEEKQSNWNYSEDTDKMEGTKQFFATSTSTNSVDFEFPYDGGSTLNIIIRNLGKENEAMLSISKGLFLTSISESESFKIKFDGEKASTYYFNSTSDGSSDVVFISNSTKFISKIKKSKKLMLEIPFFDAGNKVFEFNVEGLNWNK